MQLPGLTIGIIADDMTGANDTALQFFLAGLPTNVLLNLEQPDQGKTANQPSITGGRFSENQVWSINTDSRHLDKTVAETVVRRAVQTLKNQYGVENFYKKIDSTLRGHIAQECLAVVDELEADCAVIVPAFPQEGRRTVGGYQLVRGTPIERTQVVRDPLFPVRQSHIPTLLEQSTPHQNIVGYISLSTVLHGAGPILVELSDLIERGKKLVVIDATSQEDLEQIALAIEKIRNKAQEPYHVIPCGAAGLALALTKLWVENAPETGKKPIKKQALEFTPSSTLIISGSATDTTRQQILQLIENYAYYGQGSRLQILQVSSEQLLGLAPLDSFLEDIERDWTDNSTLILTTALKEEHYAETLNLASEHQINSKQASRLAQETLGKIAEFIVSKHTVKLVLTGGETASAVCKALKSDTLKILEEAQPTIPLLLDSHGNWIITKSGNFGEPMVLANLIRFIKERETLSITA